MAEKTNPAEQFQAQAQQQIAIAAELAAQSVKAWNEMIAASTDMAFDAVLRNWNYTKTVRAEADKAVEATVAQQKQFASEMLGAVQGYQANVQSIFAAAAKQATTPR